MHVSACLGVCVCVWAEEMEREKDAAMCERDNFLFSFSLLCREAAVFFLFFFSLLLPRLPHPHLAAMATVIIKSEHQHKLSSQATALQGLVCIHKLRR